MVSLLFVLKLWQLHEMFMSLVSVILSCEYIFEIVMISLLVANKAMIIAWSVHEPGISEYSMWLYLWSCHDFSNIDLEVKLLFSILWSQFWAHGYFMSFISMKMRAWGYTRGYLPELVYFLERCLYVALCLWDYPSDKCRIP